ncbi:gp16 family protein [Nitrosomonas sp. Nm166]|uniref:gp16 family protein n=1 Tax=Nitrosomonas sp. Nm166 TaxID=1881054 RepID=UPI0008E2BAC5|nr:regulatory protein GemA [Nitrosomonas sp. Nm166]SFF05311.1 Mu-like prophage protein gp16 [Nitrosomonas sp. Nm166]
MKPATTKELKRKRELAQIHIAKSDLGLDDDTYRAMLLDVAGVTSAADLSARGRRDVLERFISKGWTNKKHRRGKSPNTAAWKAPLMSKIGALLADQKLPWSYANGIAKQMYKIAKVDWCDEKQLRGIITALVKRVV